MCWWKCCTNSDRSNSDSDGNAYSSTHTDGLHRDVLAGFGVRHTDCISDADLDVEQSDANGHSNTDTCSDTIGPDRAMLSGTRMCHPNSKSNTDFDME